jgi:hypothetical protein
MKRWALFILVCVLWGPGALTFGADSPEPIVESLGHVNCPALRQPFGRNYAGR